VSVGLDPGVVVTEVIGSETGARAGGLLAMGSSVDVGSCGGTIAGAVSTAGIAPI
jgi:hypothetical protein